MRFLILPGLLVTSLLAAGGALAASGRAPADSPTCVALFQRFDVLQDLYPDNRARYQNRVAPPPVETQAQLVRNAGCITLTDELAPMASVKPRHITDSGRAIAPTRLHVGVVTNMQDDANVQAFFQASGIPTRSLGSAPLGRRIYVGPFATEGALAQARDLALAAGFASPYPGNM